MNAPAVKTAFTGNLAKLMVGGAIFAAACLAIDLGFARAASGWLVPAFVVALVCVVIGEVLSWHNAAAAWHERRAGSLVLWAALGLICSGGTLYTNFATSALNQDEKSSIQKTAFVTYANTADELKAAKAERTRIQERLSWMATAVNGRPVRTAEAAQSDIDNTKAHRWWDGVTEQCTKTVGPQTRAYCDKYRAALAEKDLAGEKLTLEAELKAANERVSKYDGKVATTKAVVSEDTPGVVLLTKLTADPYQARQIDSMTLPLLVQAMLVLGGILLANETYRHRERLPWVRWSAIGRAWRHIMASLTGSEPPGPAVINHYEMKGSEYDGSLARVLREKLGEMKAASAAA